MSNVLIFFILPVVTIIFAIVLQRILRSPVLVALTFFAVFLILAFTVLDISFIIYGIIYTILAYITALIAQIIYNIQRRIREYCGNNDNDDNAICDIIGRIGNNSGCNSGRSGNNCGCRNNGGGNNNNNNGNAIALDDINAISETSNNSSNSVLSSNTSNCSCNCNNNAQNVVLNAEFVPNSNNNGATGSFRGCYRRR